MADTRHTRALALAGLALVLVVSACSDGGSDSGAAATTTEAPARTTTTLSPDDAFIERAQEITGAGPDGAQSALSVAHQMCDALDAAPDPSTVGQTFATATGTGLDRTMVGQVLMAATEFLCPQHGATVEGFLRSQGLQT